jgi:hypothetical protein
MATNLSLDSELIDRALEFSGERTKKAAVTRPLQEPACSWAPSTRCWRSCAIATGSCC